MNHKVRCIIIDDDEGARALLRGLIAGHPDLQIIDECNGSASGAVSIAKHKPDLIFLDINMPGLDGYEMLEVLDNFPKIIVYTGNRELKSDLFGSLIAGYLYKPVESREFFNTVVDGATKN
ncbi:MAG: response regulator [Marinoscillum sp.]